jgi:WD40 repeat protein
MSTLQNLPKRPSNLIGTFKVLKTDFYVVGGSLKGDSPSYVTRHADTELFENLILGKFCYVLSPRQMGKSSLMIRTAVKLKSEGVSVAVLDLTAVGQNISVEQWYAGMLVQIGQQFDMEEELVDYWTANAHLGPLQRWTNALTDIIIPLTKRNVVIFIDEIDTVKSLKFNTDDFFAGIRGIYNNRARNQALENLTFCLLGVATPSDLMSDTRITPFNIGHRVELKDFREDEARQLAHGLKRSDQLNHRLLKRVLYWTNGHPYLTQKLCQTISRDISISSPKDIDRKCHELFLSSSASRNDDNLLFVRDRILRTDSDVSSLLDLYSRVLSHSHISPVKFDETNPMISLLHLSGITREEDGDLKVRNRIYAEAFDRNWIRTNLPNAELIRQRKAFYLGVARTAIVSLAIIGIVVTIAYFMWLQRNNLQIQETRSRRLLYGAVINLANQDWEKANLTRMRTLFDPQNIKNTGSEFRSFEWGYFSRLINQEIKKFDQGAQALGAAYSPDGRYIASSDIAGFIKFWDVETKQHVSTIKSHDNAVWKIAYSPDGKYLAAAAQDKSVKIWETSTNNLFKTITAHNGNVSSIDFSSDGKMLLTGSWDKQIKLWSFPDCKEIRTFSGHQDYVWSAVFSPDGRYLASTSEDHEVRLWEVKTGRLIKILNGHAASVYTASFTPDGKLLASAGRDGEIIIWDVGRGIEVNRLKRHLSSVFSLSFTSDDKYLVSAGSDRIIRFWNYKTGETVYEQKGHSYEVGTVRLSPSGDKFISTSRDGTVKLWQSPWISARGLLRHPTTQIEDVCFSPDDKIAVSASEKSVTRWDVASEKSINTVDLPSRIKCLAFSPDNRFIFAGDREGIITILDADSLKTNAQFKAHDKSVNTMAISSNGRWLASGGRDHMIKIRELPGLQEIKTLSKHNRGVRQLVFSPDDRYFISVGDDSQIVIWETASLSEVKSMSNPPYEVHTVSFSPDGNLIAVGGTDRIAHIWDWRKSKEVTTLEGHSATIRTLAFSMDGKRLVTGDEDGNLKFWDYETGLEISTFTNHKALISRAVFSRNGLVMATSAYDYTVKLWKSFPVSY